MFSTLHVGSLEQIQAKHASEYSHDTLSSLTGKPKRKRSKAGCVFCRTRKKKCDEQRPQCGLCASRDLQCVYASSERARKNGRVEKNGSAAQEETASEVLLDTTETAQERHAAPEDQGEISTELVSLNSPRSSPAAMLRSPFLHEMLATISDIPKLVEVDNEGHPLDRELESPSEKSVGWDTPSFLIEPSPFKLALDERSMHFVSYFQTEVVKFVSISPHAIQNHFENIYMSIAAQDESVLGLLATWGALFIDGPNSHSFKHHLSQAKLVASSRLESESLSDMDRFVILCLYAGTAGIGICAGDTSEWYELLKACVRIMGQFGSVRAFLERFNFSNQAKCIVANLQYHDVMLSISMKNGTLLSMSEYAAVFEDDSDFLYGVDPLQGCIHPVFLLLGEIINANAELTKEKSSIEMQLTGGLECSELEPETVQILTQKRLQYYFRASRTASELMAKVDACVPKLNQQCFLDAKELDEHLTLFEAFRNTCKLQILIYIQGLLAKAPEVQLILVDTFKLIDILIASPLRPAISMVLLMCGLCCCYPADRTQIQKQFIQLQTHYQVFNVKKIQHIVEYSWVINPDGDKIVNWAEVCESLGWILAAS